MDVFQHKEACTVRLKGSRARGGGRETRGSRRWQWRRGRSTGAASGRITSALAADGIVVHVTPPWPGARYPGTGALLCAMATTAGGLQAGQGQGRPTDEGAHDDAQRALLEKNGDDEHLILLP